MNWTCEFLKTCRPHQYSFSVTIKLLLNYFPISLTDAAAVQTLFQLAHLLHWLDLHPPQGAGECHCWRRTRVLCGWRAGAVSRGRGRSASHFESRKKGSFYRSWKSLWSHSCCQIREVLQQPTAPRPAQDHIQVRAKHTHIHSGRKFLCTTNYPVES